MDYENNEMNNEMELNENVEVKTVIEETEPTGFFAKVGAGIKKHATKIALAGAAFVAGGLLAAHISKKQAESVEDTDTTVNDIDDVVTDEVTVD